MIHVPLFGGQFRIVSRQSIYTCEPLNLCSLSLVLCFCSFLISAVVCPPVISLTFIFVYVCVITASVSIWVRCLLCDLELFVIIIKCFESCCE